MDRKKPDDDELAHIAELLRAGGTASSIGAQVGRSRGSIVGIVHRHLRHVGFSAGAPAMVQLVRKRRMLERKRIKLREAAKMKPDDIEVVEDLGVTHDKWWTNANPIKPEQLAVLLGRVPLTELRENHCRWPMWADDVPLEQKFFCGAAVARGRYCANHAAKMFAVPRR